MFSRTKEIVRQFIRSAIRRLGGLQHRRLVPEQQPGDHDRDHPGRVRSPRPRGTPRTAPRSETAVSKTGSVDPLAQRGDHEEEQHPDQHAAAGGPEEVQRHPPGVRPATSRRRSPRARSAARPAPWRRSAATRPPGSSRSAGAARSVVRSWSRRPRPAGRPPRRSPTTRAQEMPGRIACTTIADADGGEDDQADREQQDRAPVGVEVDQRGLDRGGVQQRRQQPEQHDVRLEVDLRHPRQRTTPPTPTAISSRGAGTSRRSATAVTARTPTARATRNSAISTRDIVS